MRGISLAAAAAALIFAGSAQSFEIFKDYTVSKEVSNVTFVKVKPNRVDDYLEGLKQTWSSGCAIGKKMGTLVDCQIYVSENTAQRDFNVVLVNIFPSAAVTDPNEENYNKFMKEMRAQLEEAKQDKIVEGYDEIRSFFGEQNFRRIEFK